MKSKLLAVLGLLSSALGVGAQTSTITYQGQLSSNGNAANGSFDLRFALFDAGTVGNQVGNALTNTPTGVTNGLFTVTLDFGSGVFNGSQRWLEIGVRTNGSTNAYATLVPRQPITSAPYAVRAANYGGPVAAATLTGTVSDTNLSPNVALLTNNVVFTRSVTASNFIGSGLGLTNLSATNLIGTLPDARLSANVALRNTSNVFLGSITAPYFTGDGEGLTNVPGRIFEVIPTGVSTQAVANFGYLATNNATTVVVTLPPTVDIRVGETIRVSGIGAAGWVIAQNAGQSILVANLQSSVGINWTTNGPTTPNWKAIAASADGSRLVAAASSGNLYISTNYGSTWTATATGFGNLNWSAVASSADGMKLVAAVNGNFVYTSSNGGANWTARTGLGSGPWTGVASSWDGNALAACASGNFIYTSPDGGGGWTARTGTGTASWTGIASSGNGQNLAATASGSPIWISSNGGVNWTSRGGSHSWTCIASSTDGSVLVAGVNSVNNFIFTSTDFGASWVSGTIAASWSGVGCSADGARMIAVANGGGVYVSQNSGVIWQQRNNLPTAPVFNGAAVSGDGTTMAAVAAANGIFVSSKTSTTVGTAGQLLGSRLAAVELQHVGNGVFIPISYAGTIRAK